VQYLVDMPDLPRAASRLTRPAHRWIRSLRALAAAVLLVPALALAADPLIASFSDDPDPVVAGGIVSYVVRVDNIAADAATNTRLTVSVPSGATFVSASPASANCVLQTPTLVACDLGSVAAGGLAPKEVTLRWRALGPGPATINATATVTADNDTNPANNSQSEVTTVNSGANLALTKAGSPNPVAGGSNITYTLTASNAGPNASGAMVITDNLPPAVAFVSASGSGWTCSHAAGVVTCNRTTGLAVGATAPAVTIVGTVNAAGGTITNSATVLPAAGAVADPDTADNTATVDTIVVPGADVRIAQKTVTSGTPAIAGSQVTFQIQPRNSGPATAQNAVVTDVLPAGWTFVSASGPNWNCGNSANTVTCTRADFPTSATDNITIIATAPANPVVGPGGTTYTNTASITSATNDPNPGNNSGSVNILVRPDGADLRITKTKSPNPVAQGSLVTSIITVTNNGPRAATGPLSVVEVLSGESFVSASGSGWTCDPSREPVIVCTHQALGGLNALNELPKLTIVSKAEISGTVTNTACTGGSVPAGVDPSLALPPAEGDPNPSNDCSSQGATSTTIQPDLEITKQTRTANGDKTLGTDEDSVTFRLVVRNVSGSPQAASGIRITDTMGNFFIPGRSSFGTIAAEAGSPITLNCTASGATVTCTQTGGVLQQGQEVAINIPVNRPLQDGVYINTATVFNTAEGDPNSTNNTASDTVTILPIADVEMTGKSVTPNPVKAGEIATYVLSFRNNGPSTAQNVVVTDTIAFPVGDTGATVTQITSSKSGSSCSISAGTVLTGASAPISCNIGTLANGEVQSVTLRLRPNYQPGNADRVYNNTASISTSTVESTSGGGGAGANSKSATLNVSGAQVDLLVNKLDRVGAQVFDPVGFLAGAAFLAYDVRVTNNGPSYATGVQFTEVMTPPAGRRVRFACDVTTFGGSTCNAPSLCSVANVTSLAGSAIPTFTCSVPAGNATTGTAVGDLASGSTKSVFLRFEVLDEPAPLGDIYQNSVTVSGNEPDNVSANDTANEQTTVRQRIDLRTSKTSTVATPSIMQPFDWVVTVSNNGPGNSLQTNVTDTLPAGVEVTGPITWSKTLPAATGTCTRTGVTVSCALGQLNSGGVTTITIPVRVTSYPSGGTLTNTASVDTNPSTTGGLDISNTDDSASSTVTVVRSSLAGTVFQDRDRAGANGGIPQAAAAEPRIAGVTITLTGNDAYGNAVSRSATTDAVGAFLFSNLAPADAAGYTLTQTQPAGFVNGPIAPPASGASAPTAGGSYDRGGLQGNSSYSAIALAANTQGTLYNFPEVRRPTLSGTVYLDINANGVFDAGSDTRVSGATVRLLDAGTGSVVASTTTDATGAYSFASVDPLIVYTLEEPLPSSPSGLRNGPVNPGLINGSACASGCTAQPNTPAADTDRIASVDLGSGVDGTAFNFGELALASISGTVYIDRNRNNQVDPVPTDGRISGVTVRLVQGADCSSGTVLQTAATDAAGAYAFTSVTAGATYLVCESQPAGYADGVVNPGTSATTPQANVISIAALPVTGSANNNFGERIGSLSGSVYVDYSPATPANTNNGVRDAGEAGIAGVTVTLTGTDATGASINRTAVTDANGEYAFADLLAAGPAGYTVSEGAIPASAGRFIDGKDRAGTAGGSTAVNDVMSSIALGAGVQASGYLFGELIGASISGNVFLDRNNNGVQDAPEEIGLANVPIVITGTDDRGAAFTLNLTTGADGAYSAPDLRPGTYTITEPAQPLDTTNGQTIAGSAGGTATPITTLPSAISGIVLGVGVSSTGNNFAEIPNNAEVRGRVWFDLNNNGVIDAGERGIAGVTIELTGTDVLGRAVSRSLTTDANGAYVFGELASGTYKLNEPQQPPATRNGITVAGSRGGTATPVNVLPSSISGIVLSDGAKGENYNFGELPDSPDLRVSKRAVESVFTVGFPANYRISVRNVGLLATSGVYTVSDRLPVGLVLAARPTGAGWTCDGAAGATRFSCTSSDVISAGTTSPSQISVVANVTPQAADSTPAINAVLVDGGGEIDAWRPTPSELDAFNNRPASLPACTATIELNACQVSTTVQRAAALSGTVWYDIGSTPRVLDAGDRRLAGWQVEIVDAISNTVVGRASTAADGTYKVIDLLPGVALAVRFRDPASGVVFGYPVNGEQGAGSSGVGCDSNAAGSGKPSSCVNTGISPALKVVLAPGQELVQQSLPVDPSGVVYDSGVRTPVPGSIVTLAPAGACAGWSPATSVVGAGLGGYTINGDRISMTVGADGFYQFLFGTAAPSSCTFSLNVTPPSAYTFQSTAIVPTPGPLVPPGGPGSVFNVQPQGTAPTGPVGTATTYYLTLVSGSGGANIVHNHIPLDPALPTGIALTKTGDKATVEIGDTVRYTLTVTVTAGALPRQTTIVDRLPAGVTYVPGTAMVGDKPIADPRGGVGPTLAFDLGPMPAGRQLVLRYRARVGVGAMQGDGINRAQAHACSVPSGCVDGGFNPLPGSVPTNPAAYRIRVTGGVFTTDACVLGKIYVDCNGNHIQDPEELGIPGVRLIMQDGTTLISDSEGKYSICGIPARSAVMKVDPITLPRGSRLTTSSNRNLGDAGSLWLDLKNGELHRADFIEGSCSNTVLEQVKGRRAQGEVRAQENERKSAPALRFDSKAHGLNTLTSPQQGTDGANQQVPRPRPVVPPAPGATQDESNVPTSELPMNRPPPAGRDSAAAPDAGGSNGSR
jgi:uncharacterized repeat protein (TIGR01451 family)